MTGCVTCSIGLATTENPAIAPQDLIRAADQAMYRNKRNRNRGRPVGDLGVVVNI